MDSERELERERMKELLFKEEESNKTPSGSSRNSPSASEASSRKTEAERRFEEVQKRRVRLLLAMRLTRTILLTLIFQLAERVAKLANKTHKDRVNEFNAHLESLSEHHDIPKVNGCVPPQLMSHLTHHKTRLDQDKTYYFYHYHFRGIRLLAWASYTSPTY